jgi:hypothetical protein
MGKYTGWIMLFAIAGTLSAVAAIAIQEAFVAPTLLVLTVGEWELLAVVFYILAIITYIGEGGGMRARGVQPAPFAGILAAHRQSSPRRLRAKASVIDHDAAYPLEGQAAEA